MIRLRIAAAFALLAWLAWSQRTPGRPQEIVIEAGEYGEHDAAFVLQYGSRRVPITPDELLGIIEHLKFEHASRQSPQTKRRAK
jgi:hypothetical protein